MWGDYTTRANVLAELQSSTITIPNSATLNSRIDRLITSASRAIDHWCKRPDRAFIGIAETRVFDITPQLNGPTRWMRDVGIGEGGAFAEYGGPTLTVMGIATGEIPRIMLPPMLTVPDEVAIDATLDGTYAEKMTYLTDYDLWPINGQLDGRPFLEMRWLPATATISFTVGQRALRIKSLWGFQPPRSSTQTIAVTGSPTGGSFTLTYGGQTTSAIAYNATAVDIQQALSGISTLADLTGNYQGTSTVEVSDGQLPNDTMTISTYGLLNGTGIAVGANNLTGGTSPASVIGTLTYTGSSAPADIEQACILQVIRWLKLPDAPFGMQGSPEMGYTKLEPSSDILEILEDGNYVDHWLFV